MLLKSLQPFLSINEIGPIELPSFTVIVGLNGVGKSHLLQGIEQGQLSVDILGERMPGIPPDDANVVRLVNGQVVFDTSSANSAIGSSGSSPRPGIVHPGPQSNIVCNPYFHLIPNCLSCSRVRRSQAMRSSLLGGRLGRVSLSVPHGLSRIIDARALTTSLLAQTWR